MSREEFVGLLKAHAEKHPGMLWLVFRVVCYSVGLFITLHAAETYFGDTYLANVSLFTLYSTVLELLLDRCCDWRRCIMYVAVLVGMCLAGLFLIQQGVSVQKACASPAQMESK